LASWLEFRPEDQSLSSAEVTLFSRVEQPDLFTPLNLAYQDHLTLADHIITLAVPAAPPREPISGDVAGSIIGAGGLGQCIYLVATELGVGITGVGGFRPQAFLFSHGMWPIYCLALGGVSQDDRRAKGDILAAATSHGFIS
jgi:hypothetical protein